MIDIVREIEAVQRELGEGRVPAGEGRAVRLRRTYDAPIEDVWDAVTNPERISRWFLPISGEYRIGGHYQLEGNAGGEISPASPRTGSGSPGSTARTPPMPISPEVEVRLSDVDGERTSLELVHTAVVPDEFWTQFGPGAVGVGWDGALLGLALHLRGGSVGDPVAWQLSPEGREFNTRSSQAWGEASRAAGLDPELVASMVANTTEFYAPKE